MKKLAVIFFVLALVGGIVAAQMFSFGSNIIPSPFSLVFGKKVVGSGNVVSEKRDVDRFRSIRVSSVIRVYVEGSEKTSVRVEAEDNIVPLIRTEVSDESLVLKTSGRFNSKKPVKVFVTTPNLKSIKTSGASRVF